MSSTYCLCLPLIQSLTDIGQQAETFLNLLVPLILLPPFDLDTIQLDHLDLTIPSISHKQFDSCQQTR